MSATAVKRADLTEVDRLFMTLVRITRAGASDGEIADAARKMVAEMTRKGIR